MIVERIFTSPASGANQIEHASAEFVAGLGIRGDRYFGRDDEPGQNVTLVEAEQIEAFLDSLGRPHDLSITKRNLVTRDVRLNELVGKVFTVGGVQLLGVELCEPCLDLGARLASRDITAAGVVKHFVHRAGLRANILSSGHVAAGASVQSAAMFLNLRPYQSADQEAVIRLDALALSDLSVSGLPRNFDDLKEIETRYLQNGAFVVAEIDERIVGMGAIRYIDQDTARINRMRVDPAHRRQGIARTLLNWLERQAQEAGKSRILLNTLATQEKAQQLYKSNGYVKIGEGEPDGFRVFMYEKKLRSALKWNGRKKTLS